MEASPIPVLWLSKNFIDDYVCGGGIVLVSVVGKIVIFFS